MAPKSRDVRDLLSDGTFRLDRHSGLLDPVIIKVYKAAGGGRRGCAAALNALDHAAELHEFETLQKLLHVAHAQQDEIDLMSTPPDEFDDALLTIRQRARRTRAIQQEYHAVGERLGIADWPPISSVFVPDDEWDALAERVDSWEAEPLPTEDPTLERWRQGVSGVSISCV